MVERMRDGSWEHGGECRAQRTEVVVEVKTKMQMQETDLPLPRRMIVLLPDGEGRAALRQRRRGTLVSRGVPGQSEYTGHFEGGWDLTATADSHDAARRGEYHISERHLLVNPSA